MVHRTRRGGFEEEFAFRHCAPEHVGLEATLAASRRYGGRYNPRGEFGAVYLACEAATALGELDRSAARLPRFALTPPRGF